MTSPNRISKGSTVLPGDRLATIEEFESGSGSTTSGETIVASVVGSMQPDMSNRVMIVMPKKTDLEKLPEPGDYVTGVVESVASSVAQVQIKTINDVESNKELSAMLSFRDDRRRRSSPGLRPGDIIRAKVFSTKNAIYHLSLEAPGSGVLFTVCSACGGDVVALGRDRIKCRECGVVDDRHLSDDFVTYSRSQGTA